MWLPTAGDARRDGGAAETLAVGNEFSCFCASGTYVTSLLFLVWKTIMKEERESKAGLKKARPRLGTAAAVGLGGSRSMQTEVTTVTGRRKGGSFLPFTRRCFGARVLYPGAPGCPEWPTKESFSFFFLGVVQADRSEVRGAYLAGVRRLRRKLDPSRTLLWMSCRDI